MRPGLTDPDNLTGWTVLDRAPAEPVSWHVGCSCVQPPSLAIRESRLHGWPTADILIVCTDHSLPVLRTLSSHRRWPTVAILTERWWGPDRSRLVLLKRLTVGARGPMVGLFGDALRSAMRLPPVLSSALRHVDRRTPPFGGGIATIALACGCSTRALRAAAASVGLRLSRTVKWLRLLRGLSGYVQQAGGITGLTVAMRCPSPSALSHFCSALTGHPPSQLVRMPISAILQRAWEDVRRLPRSAAPFTEHAVAPVVGSL